MYAGRCFPRAIIPWVFAVIYGTLLFSMGIVHVIAGFFLYCFFCRTAQRFWEFLVESPEPRSRYLNTTVFRRGKSDSTSPSPIIASSDAPFKGDFKLDAKLVMLGEPDETRSGIIAEVVATPPSTILQRKWKRGRDPGYGLEDDDLFLDDLPFDDENTTDVESENEGITSLPVVIRHENNRTPHNIQIDGNDEQSAGVLHSRDDSYSTSPPMSTISLPDQIEFQSPQVKEATEEEATEEKIEDKFPASPRPIRPCGGGIFLRVNKRLNMSLCKYLKTPFMLCQRNSDANTPSPKMKKLHSKFVMEKRNRIFEPSYRDAVLEDLDSDNEEDAAPLPTTHYIYPHFRNTILMSEEDINSLVIKFKNWKVITPRIRDETTPSGIRMAENTACDAMGQEIDHRAFPDDAGTALFSPGSEAPDIQVEELEAKDVDLEVTQEMEIYNGIHSFEDVTMYSNDSDQSMFSEEDNENYPDYCEDLVMEDFSEPSYSPGATDPEMAEFDSDSSSPPSGFNSPIFTDVEGEGGNSCAKVSFNIDLVGKSDISDDSNDRESEGLEGEDRNLLLEEKELRKEEREFTEDSYINDAVSETFVIKKAQRSKKFGKSGRRDDHKSPEFDPRFQAKINHNVLDAKKIMQNCNVDGANSHPSSRKRNFNAGEKRSEQESVPKMRIPSGSYAHYIAKEQPAAGGDSEPVYIPEHKFGKSGRRDDHKPPTFCTQFQAKITQNIAEAKRVMQRERKTAAPRDTCNKRIFAESDELLLPEGREPDVEQETSTIGNAAADLETANAVNNIQEPGHPTIFCKALPKASKPDDDGTPCFDSQCPANLGDSQHEEPSATSTISEVSLIAAENTNSSRLYRLYDLDDGNDADNESDKTVGKGKQRSRKSSKSQAREV